MRRRNLLFARAEDGAGGRGGRLLREGKLPQKLLERFLESTSKAPEILVGAAAGEDAAVVRGEATLVLTADPITFTEENIGLYTVAVNCNDVVAMGGTPVYLTTTFLLPPGTTEERLEKVFREVGAASRKAGIYWVGGHTEVTSAVRRIVICAQAVGFLRKPPTTTAGARAGDLLLMTKWAGLEGTTLIAREKPEVTRRLLGEEGCREVLRWLEEPGISILNEGRILQELDLSAAHDPTEGGVATGVHEIAARSGVGITVQAGSVSLRPETVTLCRHFGIDPLGLLSSGVFMFTAAPEVAAVAQRLLEGQGIPVSVLGELNDRAGEVLLERDETLCPLPIFVQDELIRLSAQGSTP